MGKFRLADHIAKGAVPDSGTAGDREQIEYIDIALLDDDPRNFYELSGLDELAANIELLGLQQPLRVRPAQEPGRYVIVSGHRRRAAVRQLVEDGHGALAAIPCIVERGQASAALQELRLIYANSDTRKMTSADIGRQAERVEELLYQLKEEGYEFPGRMRDHVAEACKVSKSKLSRLKVIRENLEESWRPGYEKGNLAESAAYALAQMPQARQRVIYDELAAQGKCPSTKSEYTVKNYGDSLAKVDEINCQTYGSGPCVNREAMRKRIMGQDGYSYSYCRQCCGDCPELIRCKYACPMLAERVKVLKEDAKVRRQQEKKAKEAKALPKVEQLEALWARFAQARAASGKTVEEFCQGVGIYSSASFIEEMEQLEQGKARITQDTRLPFGYNCCLSEMQRYVKAADLLGVSLDYLLCRTDDPAGSAPQPEGQLVLNGWMPGGTLPSAGCDAVADFDLGTGKTVREVCRFFNGRFHFASSRAAIELPVVRWMVLPPVEDAPKPVPELGTGAGCVEQEEAHG